ncbi:MAG: dihydrofolate reductase [Saprospiraceae bacterium]|jgi:dihydrofolate reductase
MRIIGAIAAMTEDRVIGSENTIPWHYTEDFKRFKRVTLNSVVIMGRNTWESIGSKPLPKRRNIVISRKGVSNVECYDSIDAAFNAVAEDENIWVIGGGQIYKETLMRCNLLDITTVPDHIDKTGSVTFPEITEARWVAGPSKPLAADPRLINQRFILQSDASNTQALTFLDAV